MSQQKVCAFCSKNGSLTKEHLWPAALHKRLQNARGDTENLFYLLKLESEILAEPTIKDVCSNCNNVLLSELDSYICFLFDKYFAKIYERDEEIIFEYDYHKLVRWLLKLCYNSARVNNGRDLFIFDFLKEYILVHSLKNHSCLKVFVGLTYPDVIPEDELPTNYTGVNPVIYRPELNRVGHALFQAPDGRYKLMRAVHLRSFSFTIAYFAPETPETLIKEFMQLYLDSRQKLYLLPQTPAKFTLICGSDSAWESIKQSRSKFVFIS